MNIVNKNEGPKIAYEQDNYRIYFGDDELMLRADRYQRAWPVHLDVCSNRDRMLGVGTGDGYYVAEIDIPAIEYAEPESEDDPPVPIPLDMDEVALTLWSLDNPTPVEPQ